MALRDVWKSALGRRRGGQMCHDSYVHNAFGLDDSIQVLIKSHNNYYLYHLRAKPVHVLASQKIS